jgi:hypothetical protein
VEIITRAEVGYVAPKRIVANGRVEGIIAHWVGSPHILPYDDVSKVKARLRGIQNYEMFQKSPPLYDDIAYNYLFDGAGRVYEGRTDKVKDGASNSYNGRVVSVCYVGGPGTPFTEAAKRALTELCQWLAARHPVLSYVWPHSKIRPSPTACPGDEIRAFLPTIVLRPVEIQGVPVRIVAHPAGGYYIVKSSGSVHPFGAPFHGDLSKIVLSAPIVDAEVTPSGKGYWLLGQDGGVFAFGDAPFIGRV